jgi:hypothetical protein
MAIVLIGIASVMVYAMFRLAAAGKPLHHDFADRAAAVDGEMVDVISNMPVYARLAASGARTAASTARSIWKWELGSAACAIWRNYGSSTRSSPSC